MLSAGCAVGNAETAIIPLNPGEGYGKADLRAVCGDRQAAAGQGQHEAMKLIYGRFAAMNGVCGALYKAVRTDSGLPGPGEV